MIAPAASPTNGQAPRLTAPTIWGLTASELHEAYWRSRGVQVIERAKAVPLQRGAELYLLVEPRQLVHFDIRAVADRMAWNRTTVMRLRISNASNVAYRERIIEDDSGSVERVERVYGTGESGARRVILTRHSSDALMWQQAESRRAAWMDIRRSRPYFRIEHWQIEGSFGRSDSSPAATAFLNNLVVQWKDPMRAIAGIEELCPGVTGVIGARLPAECLMVPPVWLGMMNGDSPEVVIGPCCERDSLHEVFKTSQSAHVREIIEIEQPAAAVDTPSRPVKNGRAYDTVKRLLDFFVSASMLMLLSPLLVAIALVILIDDGRPVLFKHRRQSRGGRDFLCLKFRTMRRDAEDMKFDLANANTCDGPQFHIPKDPRVTRAGGALRRWHLDELPQLWNVLIGDMSLVGPRPSPDSENQMCPAWRETRLSVRPGVTGLWQVERTRAPGLDFQEWIRFDTEYVDRMSFWLDLEIVMKTIGRVLRSG